MDKKDIPLYALLLVFAFAGLLVVKHGTDKAVAKNNLFVAESQAAAALRATSATSFQKIPLEQNSRSVLKGWAAQNYGASYPEKTISGKVHIVYEEKAKDEGSAKAYLRSGSEIYELKNIAGPVPVQLDGAAVELTGLASNLRDASKDKELIVNIDSSDLNSVKAPRAAAKSWQGGRNNAVCDGNFCALVIPIDTTGNPTALPAKTDIYSYIMDGQIREAFAEQSYGVMEYDGLVTDWISVSSATVPLWTTLPEVSQYLLTNNINISNYDQIVFLVNGGLHSSGGLASLGNLDLDVNGAMYSIPVARVGFSTYQNNADLTMANGNLSYFSHLYIHETGHNLGAGHDSLLNCAKNLQSLPSECLHEEYGNVYSTMGNGSLGSHFSFLSKIRIGWLSQSNIVHSVGGSHALSRIESPGASVLGIDHGMNGSPEYVFERRESTGFDTVSLFSDTNLNGAFVYRLVSTNGWTNLPTDPVSWDMKLVDFTQAKGSSVWPNAIRDAVFKIPHSYSDVQRSLLIKQNANGNNNLIDISPGLATNISCTMRPIQVFDAPGATDPFVGQIAAQRWPMLTASNPNIYPNDISGNVSDVNSQVLIYKSIVIFNDDRMQCPASDYSFKLKFAGTELPLMSDTTATYPSWGGPYYQTIFAYLPAYGLTYGNQTVTLEITKLNDGTVFSKDLVFELVP